MTPPASKQVDNLWRLLPVGLALFSLTISAYTGYTKNDRELVQRVTATEAHQKDDRQTLEEIKADVKEMKAKVVEILIVLSTKR